MNDSCRPTSSPPLHNPPISHDFPEYGFVKTFIDRLQAQQEAILSSFARSVGELTASRFEVPKFDDQSVDPQSWMLMYERGCQANGWNTDSLKITNLVGHFEPYSIAYKWYCARLLEDNHEVWSEWRISFLNAFGENCVFLAHRAHEFGYKGGPLMDYYYEKVRRLQIAYGELSARALNTMILMGLPEHMQELLAMYSGSRIIGGEVIGSNKYPFLVAIVNYDPTFTQYDHHCGGSLISHRHVVSAGHCFVGYDLRMFAVRLGSDEMTNPSTPVKLIDNITVHPDYLDLGGHSINDIAMITLNEAIVFSSNYQPVCLPSPTFDITGHAVTTLDLDQRLAGLLVGVRWAFGADDRQYTLIRRLLSTGPRILSRLTIPRGRTRQSGLSILLEVPTTFSQQRLALFLLIWVSRSSSFDCPSMRSTPY
ncbi:hypothetical protein GE061_010073 [Apolygus lucorum]|uniref:Peptidase S1 domain-containing protein n=1 Tax=Apolygus lucorum TaxID=248454 RepID=A0A8S9Y432_APOLU|nr:hypothetical protein GE061_010073 [Apolygus lucorum]